MDDPLELVLMLLLKSKDFWALIFSGGRGFLAGTQVTHGWLSIIVSILVSYHLFLAWLLLTSEEKVIAPFTAVYSLGTHLACVAVILALVLSRSFVPHFDVVCCCFAGLAFFERNWLFRTV